MASVVQVPQPRELKFAVREHIRVLAIVCECGKKIMGKGVRTMKKCPYCFAFIITRKDREATWRIYGPSRQEIQDKYERAAGGVA